MGLSIEEQREKIREHKKQIILDNTKRRLSNRLLVEEIFIRGIYFLYFNDKVVYIGQSYENVMQRICDHFRDEGKIFDSFSFKKYDVSSEELLKIEASLIKKIKPKYNIIHKRKLKLKFVSRNR
jgi:hypothetical protein